MILIGLQIIIRPPAMRSLSGEGKSIRRATILSINFYIVRKNKDNGSFESLSNFDIND